MRLAHEGNEIAVAYGSNAEAAERVASEVRELGRVAGTFAADMADAEAPGALVAAVERELGPVDIVIANAGINDPLEQDPRKIDAAAWDRTMAIRLTSGPRSCSLVPRSAG